MRMIYLPIALLSLLAVPCSANQEETLMKEVAIHRITVLLYYTPYCPYSREVLAYLNEIHKQIPVVNVSQNPEAKKELETLGGRLEVPCLMVEGHPIYRSSQIIQWLSEHQNDLEDIQ